MDEVEDTYSQIYEILYKEGELKVGDLNQIKKLLENLYLRGIVRGCENTLRIFKQEQEMACLGSKVRRQIEEILGGEDGGK